MNAMLSIFCLIAAVLSSVNSAPYLNYYYNTPYNYAAYRNALYAGLAHLYPSAAAAPVVAAAAAPAAAAAVVPAAAAVAPAAAVLPAAALAGAPVTPLDAYAAAMRYLQYGYGYGYGYPYTAPYTYPYYKKK